MRKSAIIGIKKTPCKFECFKRKEKCSEILQWENEYLRSAMGKNIFGHSKNMGRFREWKKMAAKFLHLKTSMLLSELFYNK